MRFIVTRERDFQNPLLEQYIRNIFAHEPDLIVTNIDVLAKGSKDEISFNVNFRNYVHGMFATKTALTNKVVSAIRLHADLNLIQYDDPEAGFTIRRN